METIKYYLFCMKWLWKNRNWKNTRQKFKRMEMEWEEWENTRKK